jgi:hypothetical protein
LPAQENILAAFAQLIIPTLWRQKVIKLRVHYDTLRLKKVLIIFAELRAVDNSVHRQNVDVKNVERKNAEWDNSKKGRMIKTSNGKNAEGNKRRIENTRLKK